MEGVPLLVYLFACGTGGGRIGIELWKWGWYLQIYMCFAMRLYLHLDCIWGLDEIFFDLFVCMRDIRCDGMLGCGASWDTFLRLDS